ncbi:MAG: poly-gamma-glutamate synthase PgsB [Candidatus Saccharicenans sp.]|uniref:poly-gamma-glutamate synthase PgsB n=1 Tax=Candidatus Saccharicenans sp. TaxID=2819258 RepID=UPI00404B51D0
MFQMMDFIPVFSLLIYLIYLGVESRNCQRRRKKIPSRIAVSGIRGKSSLVRLIACGLRAGGFRVMAKTTGSKPVLIYPDGREEEIRRRGKASILEQKKLVRCAAAEQADFLVSEMMSIQPECLMAEGRYLLQPKVMVLSNFRVDHTEFLGRDREEVARKMMAAVPAGPLVFLPEEELRPWMQNLARDRGFELKAVKGSAETARLPEILPYPEFEPNLRLALAVLEHLGITKSQARSAWSGLNPDYGRPRAWKIKYGKNRFFYLVSLFAANDPESSLLALEFITHRMGWQENPKIGWLSLRADRGDRTAQWADFLKSGKANFLESLALTGPGARALRHKIKKSFSTGGREVRLISARRPEASLEEIIRMVKECQKSRPAAGQDCLVFGLGNIGGFGSQLIDYLERTADAVRI